jgi:hypothetical protein
VTKARVRRLRRPTSPYVLNYFDVSFPISIFNDTPQSGEGQIEMKMRERELGEKTMQTNMEETTYILVLLNLLNAHC